MNKQNRKKNIPLSKKQKKRMEKAGLLKAPKEKKERAKMPREKKWFLALVAAICVMAIASATFGGILIARVVSDVPYASSYEKVDLRDYLVTDKMGKDFYTGQTIDLSGIDEYYAPYTLEEMDAELEALRYQHRKLLARQSKTAVVGYGDDISIYLVDILTETGERVPIKTITRGTYTSAISLTVGNEYFDKDFDEKLVALAVKPSDTGRDVRYNGTVSLSDVVCLSYTLYKSTGTADSTAEKEVDRYKWSTTASASLSGTRVVLSEDIDAALAEAIVANTKAVGEPIELVLADYSPSGDGSNRATYKLTANVHFVVTEEKTVDVKCTLPDGMASEGDGADAMAALNGKTVTMRIVIASMNDYELPTLDRKFVTETLGYETEFSDDTGALLDYKNHLMKERNEQRAKSKQSTMRSEAYLFFANKAQSGGLFLTVSSYPTELWNDAAQTALSDLKNLYIQYYGAVPSTSQLDAFAVQYAQSTYGIQVQGYSQYVSLAAESNISQELLMHYIYRHAGLSVTDEQIEARYEERLASFIESAGDSETYNREYFISYYGEETLYKQARRALIYEAVADYLLANNTVKTAK